MSTASWLCAVVTLISGAVSAGYAMAGLRGSTGDARTASKYALTRSLALLLVAMLALIVGTSGFVVAIAVSMILVQAFDAVVGVTIGDRMKTYGPAALALTTLAALIWVLAS